jgi:hypothetical protein
MRLLTCLALLIVTMAVAAEPADAAKRKAPRSYEPVAVKDCTRVNGQWGYYGNQWCSPAEQQAWDRAEARRLGR